MMIRGKSRVCFLKLGIIAKPHACPAPRRTLQWSWHTAPKIASWPLPMSLKAALFANPSAPKEPQAAQNSSGVINDSP